MAQDPHDDNSVLWNAKSWGEIKRMASTEQFGDRVLAIRKFAEIENLSTSSDEDIWDAGGILSLLSSAETMSIASTSANDTLGGSGAQIILIDGLDNDYNLIQEVINLSGTTPVVTVNSYIRVHRLRVVFSGTGKTNAGVITATASTAATTQAQILAGKSITRMSHFTIPNGYTGFTTHVVMSCFRSSGSGAREAEVTQNAYTPDTNTIYKTLTYGITNNGGMLVTSPEVPSVSPAKTTVWYSGLASGANTEISTIQEILLLKGNYNLRTEI